MILKTLKVPLIYFIFLKQLVWTLSLSISGGKSVIEKKNAINPNF